MERRLTAILAADVVGYSRLMGEDEAGTLAALKAHRAELIKPKAAQYSGRTIKLMGDGALMEFPSVVDAVGFAVEVQSAMQARNEGRHGVLLRDRRGDPGRAAARRTDPHRHAEEDPAGGTRPVRFVRRSGDRRMPGKDPQREETRVASDVGLTFRGDQEPPPAAVSRWGF